MRITVRVQLAAAYSMRQLSTNLSPHLTGYFPIKLQSLPEGSCVHAHVPVFQITTEGPYAPLCTFLEVLLTMVWCDLAPCGHYLYVCSQALNRVPELRVRLRFSLPHLARAAFEYYRRDEIALQGKSCF